MRVLDDAFAHFERQVQPAKRCIADFEVFHDAQCVQVVVEKSRAGAWRRRAPFRRHARRADARCRGREPAFQPGRCSVRAEQRWSSRLGHFQRMREAIAKMIGMPKCEDLRFIFEAAESACMNDAVPVALEIIAVGMRRLGEAAPAGLFDAYREVSEHVGRIAKFGSQEWAFTVQRLRCKKRQPKRLSFCNSVLLVYCFSPSSFATLTLAASNFF